MAFFLTTENLRCVLHCEVYSIGRDDQLPQATDVRHMALGDE